MAEREDYLHECLRLHWQVSEIRYGKLQDLADVESRVVRMWEKQASMWEVVEAIHDAKAFDASMFGSFDRSSLKSKIDKTEWHDLAVQEHKLIPRLFEAFRQIEPVSVVLRFIDPVRFGIMSSPVQTVLGIRPRRKQTATYGAYLKSLRQIREKRRFERVADVEMALWVLQVGVLDGVLPTPPREELAKDYEEDAELRRIQTRNLTVQLLNEMSKLDVADALIDTDVALAGQIAGIEFELLVVAASQRGGEQRQKTLEQHIDSLGLPYRRLRRQLNDARFIRNNAIHNPKSVIPADVEYLIIVAKKLQSLEKKPT